MNKEQVQRVLKLIKKPENLTAFIHANVQMKARVTATIICSACAKRTETKVTEFKSKSRIHTCTTCGHKMKIKIYKSHIRDTIRDTALLVLTEFHNKLFDGTTPLK